MVCIWWLYGLYKFSMSFAWNVRPMDIRLTSLGDGRQYICMWEEMGLQFL
jgi:hypothetical protein